MPTLVSCIKMLNNLYYILSFHTYDAPKSHQSQLPKNILLRGIKVGTHLNKTQTPFHKYLLINILVERETQPLTLIFIA